VIDLNLIGCTRFNIIYIINQLCFFFVFVIVKLEHLNNLSKKNHIIIQQLERGQRVTRPLKIKYLANSERIMTATRQLTLGIITVKEFLLQCSHSAETYLRQEINWHNNIEQGIIKP